MSFFSGIFILLLTISIILYFGFGKISNKKQWVILLITSYIFYTSGNIYTAKYLIITTITTYFAALLINKIHINFYKNIILFLCLFINIGILATLKYTGLISPLSIRNIESIIIPLGISYYTFQSLGYCIDVFRGIVTPQKNFLKYALFVSYFPQIISGPINRYNNLFQQFENLHKFDYHQFCNGLERVLLGLFKKFVIANNLAFVVDSIYKNPLSYSGSILLFITFLYGIQLYMDFSGYIDIALGISKCFGINLSENFKTPFFSKSIKEYWRRWHITLGAWFRDYVYYSLLRLGIFNQIIKERILYKLILSICLIITWALIGLWHGAKWNFVFFGLFHCFFIITDVWFDNYYKKLKKFLHIKPNLKIWNIFQILRTYIIVNFGFVLFRADNVNIALGIYKKIFSEFSINSLAQTVILYWQNHLPYCIILSIGILSILLIEIIETKQKFADWIDFKPIYIKWPILYILIIFSLMEFCNTDIGTINFIYHRF